MKIILLWAGILSTSLLCAQATIYVNPDAVSDNSTGGSTVAPYNDIAIAVNTVAAAGGGEVIVLDGTYDMTGREIRISTAATAADPVTIKPQNPYGVTFIFEGRFGFEFDIDSRHITLEGFELNGNTSELDFWCVVAQAFWGDQSIELKGGLAVILDGQYITIKDNYIHDFYQKAVEIRSGRYVVVEGNIIKNIAHTSLTGGHGIMRQQKGEEFFDNDVPNVYRWDIRENMIMNVEQRIYSWVPSKGFIEMAIDEGKSILIDDPKDTDGNQENMSARIINNVIAFGVVDHIRLKSTPGLEVSNNSIYSQAVNGDGITDKGGDTNTPKFSNFICRNNASHTASGISAIEIDQAVAESAATGTAAQVSNNYAMDGRIKPPGQTGLTRLTNGQLFVDPNGGDFSINPSLSLPANVGVNPAVLTDLGQKATNFNVFFGATGFVTDHLKLTQTILDNAPGLNDGIPGNESVFTDYGTMSSNYHTITFNVVTGGAWAIEVGAPATMDFHLNEIYYNWYAGIATTYLNAAGNEYERIRWGDSEIKQNQAFDPDWLTVSKITASENTLINGYDNDFILDGDLLVEFAGFTPQAGASFDLISAGSITTANAADLFDRVLFSGYTPDYYTLEVVNTGGAQVVRLTILAALPVTLLDFTATKADKIVRLDWATGSESANHFFAIERSSDGIRWQEIGRVDGQGDASQTTTYTFPDEKPIKGLNYYRLRQNDFGGASTYSSVRTVEFAAPSSIEVFPNPATSWFDVTTSLDLTQVHLLNALGQNVTKACIVTQNHRGFRFQTNNLESGVYYLTNGKESIKITIR